MRDTDGYELIGLYEDAALVGVLGFIRLTNLISDDFPWVRDLVIDRTQRGRGFLFRT